jgi:hypothetical protein
MKHARLKAKQWTNIEDDRLRSLAISGMNAWGIAAELERTVAAVRARAERSGVSLRRVTVAPSRHLVELGLTVGAAKTKQAPAARADRAKELAAQTIDKMGDAAAHPEEHAQRSGRLTKGPEEFREVRVDRPKAKR